MLIAVSCCLTACNDEWNDEQYEQWASFKTQPDDYGLIYSYLRYKPDGQATFQLPVIISGSTANEADRVIHFAIDPDTLADLNIRKFGSRPELYFQQLEASHYSFPDTIHIAKGSSQGVLPISFNMKDLDEVEKWVLPITITDDPSYNYTANPHKYFRKAILRVRPFNDFSGQYSGTNLLAALTDDESTKSTASTHRAYVVNDSTVFFYAGLRDENYLDRRSYKIFVHFTNERYRLGEYYCDIYTDNPELNLTVTGRAHYSVQSEMDQNKPYLKHTYITISDIDYAFDDYTTVAAYRMRYHITGSVSLQRDLNTLVPDQDQGIQW